MSEVARCPDCGAMNPAGAAWCGQCLRRLGRPPEQSPVVARPAAVEETRAAEPEPVASHETAEVPGAGARPSLAPVPAPQHGVRREGDAVLWTCPACEATNSVELLTCSVCGTALATLFRSEPETARPAGRAALGWSAVLPGAGHFAVGLGGAGLARAVLWAWTLAVGLFLALRDVRRNGALVHGLGIVFLFAAAGVWVLSFAEVRRALRGDRTLIAKGRALTWATAGLTFLLFAGLAAIAQSR